MKINQDGITADVEVVVLVKNPIFPENCSDDRAGDAGDNMDKILVRFVKELGVTRFLIVLPDDCPNLADEQLLRIVERRVNNKVVVN